MRAAVKKIFIVIKNQKFSTFQNLKTDFKLETNQAIDQEKI